MNVIFVFLLLYCTYFESVCMMLGWVESWQACVELDPVPARPPGLAVLAAVLPCLQPRPQLLVAQQRAPLLLQPAACNHSRQIYSFNISRFCSPLLSLPVTNLPPIHHTLYSPIAKRLRPASPGGCFTRQTGTVKFKLNNLQTNRSSLTALDQ